MGELTQKTIDLLNSATTVEELDSCAWIAADLLSKLKVTNFNSGFKEIDSESLTHEEGEQLKESLINALTRSSDPRFIQALIGALGASYDPSFKQLYIDFRSPTLKGIERSKRSDLCSSHSIGQHRRECL